MRKFALSCFVLIALAASAFAQLTSTTFLVGTVTDNTGASMAGVQITAVNTGTRETYTATTNAEGYYNIEFVKIGTYRVTAKQQGFATVTVDGVVVETNRTARADLTLKVGDVTETLEVTATTPPISTDDASIKETINQKSVAELPLSGRNALQLAITTPTVIQGLKDPSGTPPGEGYIAAGTREIQNSVSLDGISIMNNLITTTPYHPSVDAIQELEVQTGTYSAQYGAYMGAHLNLVSKGGGNIVHGAVFEFLRNDKLDSRNYFAAYGKPKPPLRQNQFGFELDGPVYIPKLYDGRNKTFFMADYEGLRRVSQLSSQTNVFPAAYRTGDFSALSTPLKDPLNGGFFPGNIIPSSRLSPQAQKLLSYMPLPNTSGANNYANNYPSNDNFNQTIDRLDQSIGNARLFFRYAWQNENLFSGNIIPSSSTTIPVQTRNWVVGWTQTLGASMVNDLRVGRQRLTTNSLNYWYVNGLTSAGADLGIPGFDGDARFANPGIPTFSIPGYTGLGNGSTNWFQTDTTWQGADSFTWTHGKHTLIGGVEIRKIITGRSAVNSAQGVFNFSNDFTGNSAANFMLGLPLNDTTPGPQINNIVAQWRDGFFLVDNWRATKRLTLNLGVRYELPTVPYTVNGYATILNSTWTAMVPDNPPQRGFSFIDPNHKNLAPRVGFAYRATDKTVIRGGYGIYYNPNQNNTFTFLSNNPPFSIVTTYNSVLTSPTLSFNNPTPSGSVGSRPLPNVISPARNLPTAYMNQWSFDVEQGLWHNAALDLQYLGSHSLHLDRSYYPNTPLTPGAGSVASRRPNPYFAQIRIIQNDEIANYEGMSVVFRQRMSHGLNMLASYTWSHTLDVSTDSNGGGAPMDPYNWRRDYGNSNWDIRHRFITNFGYELPFFKNSSVALLRQTLGGWQTNGIVTWQGGLPFNVTVPGDPANTGVGNQRPNLIGAVSASCGDQPQISCIQGGGFTLPTQYTYGSAGRNLLRGPGVVNADLSFFKNFRFAEKLNLQFRSELFNIFNHANFSNPNGTFNTANFGTITSTRIPNRQVQFGLKLLF